MIYSRVFSKEQIDEYDFSGKIIIPFVTHGTGGLGYTEQEGKYRLRHGKDGARRNGNLKDIFCW